MDKKSDRQLDNPVAVSGKDPRTHGLATIIGQNSHKSQNMISRAERSNSISQRFPGAAGLRSEL